MQLSLHAASQAFPQGNPRPRQASSCAGCLVWKRRQYRKLKTPLPALHLQSGGTRAMIAAGSHTAHRYCQVQPDGCTAVPGTAPGGRGGGGGEHGAHFFSPGCSALPASGGGRFGEHPGVPARSVEPCRGAASLPHGAPTSPPCECNILLWVFLTLVTKLRFFFLRCFNLE